jgi:hypothetical protein
MGIARRLFNARPGRGVACGTRARPWSCRGAHVTAIGAFVVLAGCGSTTLFRSNFEETPENQPPAAVQAVGTAAIHGGTNAVLVVAAPVTPSGRWVRIERPVPDSNVAGFQGRLAAFHGDGHYTFTTTVFMPAGAGAATIQFERFDQPVTNFDNFLHLDLMPENNVRVDDDESTRFGSFPRDQPFVVQVRLIIDATPRATIGLSGANASGNRTQAIRAALVPMARQFGGVRLWMGFPHLGSFSATNISVTRRD